MPRSPTDPLDTAAALNERAVTLLHAGRHALARKRAEQAVDLFARHAGKHHPDVASCLDTLAMIRAAQGAERDAVKLLERALAIYDRYPRVRELRAFRAQSLARMGDTLRALGRYTEARAVFGRALRVMRGAFGEDSIEHATALNSYGILCKFAGWFAAGERAYLRALAIAEAPPGDPELVCALLHNLGGLEHARDRFVEAEPYARRGYELRAERLGENSPEALEDCGALAAIVADLGRFDEAEAMLRGLLSRFEDLYGASHYEVSVVCHNLASVLSVTGRLDEADALYRRALAIKRARLGAAHPDVALTLHNLAALCDARGDAREALALHRKAHALARRTLGPKHPTTVACRASLARSERSIPGAVSARRRSIARARTR